MNKCSESVSIRRCWVCGLARPLALSRNTTRWPATPQCPRWRWLTSRTQAHGSEEAMKAMTDLCMPLVRRIFAGMTAKPTDDLT